MNKKLTPLQALELFRNSQYQGVNVYADELLDIIETELKENEKLKECYKNELKNTAYYNYLALKYKKALEIIKEKEVDVGWLKRAKDLHEYNSGMGINSYSALNQEEYKLLKEILK